jgi:hypothetical protein
MFCTKFACEMRRVFLWLIAISILATSCSKKEQPYVLPPGGDAAVQTLNMGSNYEFQFFYNLKSQQVVHISRVASWDLAFESGFDGKQVLINGGNNMAALRTNVNFFSQINRTYCEGKKWSLDDPKGGNGCSVFGEWDATPDSRDKVYVLRMDAVGNNYRKLKIKSATNFGYVIEVADIDAAFGTEIFVEKQANSNFTYFDLSLLQVVQNIEPAPETWDIVFTRYGHTFYDEDPPLLYAVTGVLLNPMSTLALKDSINNFYELNENSLSEGSLSKDRNVIGFDWKEYNIDKGVYEVKQQYNYIVKTKENNYFKLRFIDFYSANGIKGSPTFELAQIK